MSAVEGAAASPFATEPPTTPSETVDAFSSAFAANRGLPLLLLHGAGSSHMVWPPRLRRLPGRIVLALDWPGHGRSHKPGLARIEEFEAAALAHVDAAHGGATHGGAAHGGATHGGAAHGDTARVERFVVAGHSLGSAVALQMALDAPERVAGVIVVAGGARLPVSAALLALLRDEPEKAASRIVRWSYGPHTSDGTREKALRFLQQMNPETIYRAFAACSEWDVSARLSAITAPVLVLAGAEDRMVPLSVSEELRAGLPNSHLVVLPETGHMIPVERPREITALVQGEL